MVVQELILECLDCVVYVLESLLIWLKYQVSENLLGRERKYRIMSLSDPIADMLTRIRNAINARYSFCEIPYSKIKENILKIFKDQGYISDYEIFRKDDKFDFLKVHIKYYKGDSVIRELKRISKPGRRIYFKNSEIYPFKNNIGNFIISTSKGILTGKSAKNLNLGGEVICSIA